MGKLISNDGKADEVWVICLRWIRELSPSECHSPLRASYEYYPPFCQSVVMLASLSWRLPSGEDLPWSPNLGSVKNTVRQGGSSEYLACKLVPPASSLSSLLQEWAKLGAPLSRTLESQEVARMVWLVFAAQWIRGRGKYSQVFESGQCIPPPLAYQLACGSWNSIS